MHTIARQILTSVLLTMIIVLGGWSVVEIVAEQRTEGSKLTAEAQLTADRLAHNVAYPLWNKNRVEVEKDLLFELRAATISAAIVLDDTGSIYTGKVETADGRVESWNQDNPYHRKLTESGAKNISTDIVHSNKTIGRLVIYTNHHYL